MPVFVFLGIATMIIIASAAITKRYKVGCYFKFHGKDTFHRDFTPVLYSCCYEVRVVLRVFIYLIIQHILVNGTHVGNNVVPRN